MKFTGVYQIPAMSGTLGKAIDQTKSAKAGTRWDDLRWQDKSLFLHRHGFPLGWSSHTWKYLERRIQAAFEIHCGL